MLSFLDLGSVPLRKVFWVGIIVSVFNPPIVGLAYALLYAFRPDTRRMALYVGIWTALWTVLYGLLIHFLIGGGYLHVAF
jgi:threonine/homoserine/homoserine lactone efflux protein